MFESLVLYIGLLLLYVPGLIFVANRDRLLRFPVTSFTFLGLFVFNIVGSIFIIFPELSGRDDHYRPEYLFLLAAQGVIFYAIAFPYVCFAKTNRQPVEINHSVDRTLLAIMMMMIAGLTVLYFLRVGPPPLLAIMKGNLHLPQIIQIRTDTVYGLDEFWLYNLGFTTIPLIAAIYALAMRALCPEAAPRAKWIILVCLCVNALPGGKGNVLDFCTSLLVAYFLLAGYGKYLARHNPSNMLTRRRAETNRLEFSYKKTAMYLAAAFVPVLVMYKVYLGPKVEFGDLLSQLLFRIVGVYTESIAAAVAYVEQKGPLGGMTLPTIRGLLSHERILLDSEMHNFMFGAPGSVTLSGPAEGYLNFGLAGFLFMAVATFVAMVVVEELLKNMRRTVLSLSILAFYSTLATKAAQISLFSVFVSLTYVGLIGVLIVVRFGLVVWQEFGRTVRSPRSTI